MPVYRYKAFNENNHKMRGEITAANDIDLEDRLREVGLVLVDYREVSARSASPLSKIKINDMIVMCVQLEQLDRAGVPLLDSLADTRDSTESPKLRDVLSDVYESVKSGVILSQALAKHPKIFDTIFVGLVAAGEKTGKLAASFGHLAHHLKWISDIRRKVRKAMSYPIALFFVIIGVITVLMLNVVPKLTDFMLSQGFDLPIHTRALIATSHFFGDYWYVVLLTPPLCIAVLKLVCFFSPDFAYKFDGFILRLPVLGQTMRKLDLARFTHFFGIMFRSGIDILESIEAAQKVVKNRVLAASVAMVQRSVSEGNSLTTSLRMSNQFPNLVVRMFKVGEDSGNMDESLENINFFYDREVNDAVEKMVGMVQPAMTVLLGLMILWVVAGVFGPLYETFGKMKF
jgi:type IV pilus assembly protein PilC